MALQGCGAGRGCSDTQAQYPDYPQVTHRTTGTPSCDLEFEQVLENKNETSSRITFLYGGCESEFARMPHTVQMGLRDSRDAVKKFGVNALPTSRPLL